MTKLIEKKNLRQKLHQKIGDPFPYYMSTPK